jgi:hypothetical protein
MRFEAGDYELKLTGYSGACAIEQAGVSHEASATYTAFHFVLPAGADTLAAGTYTVTPDPTASLPVQVEIKTLDSACNSTTDLTATSGSLTLDEALSSAGGELSGSYSVTFPGGMSYAGTFSAASCAIPTDSPSGTCVTGSSVPTFDAGTTSPGFDAGTGTGSGTGTGGSTEACGIDMSSAACASCVTTNCCSENETCASDSSCESLLACIGACSDDMTCENNCIDATTDAAAQELDNAASCWSSSCSAQGC